MFRPNGEQAFIHHETLGDSWPEPKLLAGPDGRVNLYRAELGGGVYLVSGSPGQLAKAPARQLLTIRHQIGFLSVVETPRQVAIVAKMHIGTQLVKQRQLDWTRVPPRHDGPWPAMVPRPAFSFALRGAIR